MTRADQTKLRYAEPGVVDGEHTEPGDMVFDCVINHGDSHCLFNSRENQLERVRERAEPLPRHSGADAGASQVRVTCVSRTTCCRFQRSRTRRPTTTKGEREKEDFRGQFDHEEVATSIRMKSGC